MSLNTKRKSMVIHRNTIFVVFVFCLLINHAVVYTNFETNSIASNNTITLPNIWHFPYFEIKERPSSSPYITGDSLRAYCNHIIDPAFDSFDPTKVKQDDIIFLYPHYLDIFFSKIHPHIEEPYILITHNSDHSIPRYDSNTPNMGSGDYSSYLDDDKLIAWFSKNATGKHHKLFNVPIGIANALHGSLGNIKTLRKVNNTKLSKKYLLCMNFNSITNRVEREPIEKRFLQKKFCHRYIKKERSNHIAGQYTNYLKDMAASKFVLSPDGTGIECYRTWEAMYVDCIPIVKSGPLDHLYDDLPVLIVDDWNIITEELLNAKYEEFKHRTFNLEKLYIPYWINKIETVKREFSSKNEKA